MSDIEQSHGEITSLVERVLERLGVPEDGNQKPTGLYGKIDAIDRRVTPFEKAREQTKGAMKVLMVTMPPIAVTVWFLAGEKITHLLHG